MYLICDFEKVSSPKKLLVKGARNVEYKGKSYSISKPELSNRPSKKYKVTVEEKGTGTKKTVHWGAKGMSDYTIHKDSARRERFQARHQAIKLKDGTKAADNPLQPAYYATHYNW